MKSFTRTQAWVAIAAILGSGSTTLSAENNVWTRIGPEGGSVQRLLVDPQNPSTLYAVAGGAIFKTMDGARTWRLAISGLTSANVSAIAIDSQSPGKLYALTSTGGFKSADGGMSWNRINSFPERANALAVDPRSGTIYVRTCTGVARSADGGETWRETVFPPPSNCYAIFAIDPSGALYTTRTAYIAGGVTTSITGRIFKSSDGGESWSALELGATSVGVYALAFDPHNSGTIYALGWGALRAGDSWYRTWVFKTTDGGESWITTTALDESGGVLAVDPENQGTVYAAARHIVLKSADGGTSWERIARQQAEDDQWYWSRGSISALAVVPARVIDDGGASPPGSSTIYAGTYTRGVSKSEDGGDTWTAVNSGLTAADVQFLRLDPQGTLYGVLGGVDIVKSPDSGTTWRSASSGLPGEMWLGPLAIDQQSSDAMYVPTNWRGVFKTTDGGGNWKPASAGLPSTVIGLAIDPQNRNTLYAGIGDELCWEYHRCGSSGMFKSVDGGASWSYSGLAGYSVGPVVIHPQNPSAVYAVGFLPSWEGFSSAWPWGSPSFFRSTDGGQSWDILKLPAPSINGVVTDPQQPSTAYVYGGSLLKTTDGGETWNTVLDSVRTLAIDPRTSSTLYAGTDSGVFRSIDGGASWTAVNAGLTSIGVNALAIDPRDPNTLFAGTSGGGVFRITFGIQLAVPSTR